MFETLLVCALSGPMELVDRLVSEDFEGRVAAAEALERLGPLAVPTLLDARSAADPRLRRRALLVLDRIGAGRATRPTEVVLDFDDRPLPEVIATLNRRHGFDLALWLIPDRRRGEFRFGPEAADPALERDVLGRRITLQAPEPVPFWEAIERLGRAGGLRLEASPRDRLGPRTKPFRLFPGFGGSEFGSNAGTIRAVVRSVGPGRPDAEDLDVALAIIPEPGLAVATTGPAAIDLAVDDRDRSLLPRAPAFAAGRGQGPVLLGGQGESSVILRLDRPAGTRSIARLRGSIPVSLTARKPGPMSIPLDDAAGRTFRVDGLAVLVQQVDRDPETDRAVGIDLGIVPIGPGVDWEWPYLIRDEAEEYLDRFGLYDAEGRVLNASGHRLMMAGIAFVLLRFDITPVGPDGGFNPALGGNQSASELRVFDIEESTLDVPFDFRNLPISYQRPNGPPTPPPPRPAGIAARPREVPR